MVRQETRDKVKIDFENRAWKPRDQKQEWSEMGLAIERSRENAERIARDKRQIGGSSNNSAGDIYTGSLVSSAGSVEQWRPLVARYTDWSVDTMLRIMEGESGGDPNAANWDSMCFGLLQIQDEERAYGDMIFDPAFNIDRGHDLWLTGGYYRWSVY